MNEHEDRTPLVMKVVLRQALGRLREEDADLSQLEALAGNLGWEEVAKCLEEARRGLAEVLDALQEAVEGAVRLQALSTHYHFHAHTHEHAHTHPHDHQHAEGSEGEHAHPHRHVHEHPHEHPHRP